MITHASNETKRCYSHSYAKNISRQIHNYLATIEVVNVNQGKVLSGLKKIKINYKKNNKIK